MLGYSDRGQVIYRLRSGSDILLHWRQRHKRCLPEIWLGDDNSVHSCVKPRSHINRHVSLSKVLNPTANGISFPIFFAIIIRIRVKMPQMGQIHMFFKQYAGNLVN